MYTYHFTQWLAFFYFYCFFGWCFESTYVSLVKKKFVNRGFMRGPFLPLYGSGAILILFCTMPVRENNWKIMLVGAVFATLLEYITGICMELLFKVRYWDYSKQKFNIQGHICLSSTIAWGVLSLFLVKGIHKPVEQVVFQIPSEVLTVGVFVISIIAIADFSMCFKTAVDLRDVLVKVEKMKEEMRGLQKRMDTISKVLEEEKNQSIERLKEETLEIKEKQTIFREKLEMYFSKDKYHLLRRNPSAISKKYAEILEDIKSKFE